MNEELIAHAKEKVDVWIHGYDEDVRELHEIPEFKEWLDKVVDGINGWAYFLSKKRTSQFLRVIQICNMEFKIIGDSFINEFGLESKNIEIDFESGEHLLNKLFDDLNKFTDKHNIALEVNMQISDNLVKYLSGEKYK